MTISLKQWSCLLWRTNEIRGFLQLRTNWLPWGGGLTIITHGQSGLYICTGGKGGGGYKQQFTVINYLYYAISS